MNDYVKSNTVSEVRMYTTGLAFKTYGAKPAALHRYAHATKYRKQHGLLMPSLAPKVTKRNVRAKSLALSASLSRWAASQLIYATAAAPTDKIMPAQERAKSKMRTGGVCRR